MDLRRHRRLWLARIGLVALVVSWFGPGAPGRARAQNFPGPWNNLTAGGILPLPPPPPQGALGEVIFANSQWMVVQNKDGQQFPVAAGSIGRFLIRWPADVRDLGPAVLVEAFGPELGSMTVQTDHIDLFVGSDQVLVQPGYSSVLPINRSVTAIDPTFQRHMNGFEIDKQNTLYSWVFPVSTGDSGIPSNMHVVGNSLAFGPLRVGVPGNNLATIVPPPGLGSYSISRVTQGSTSFARKGDFAFLTPIRGNAVGEKSLKLAEVVLYKKIRRDRYVP
jgi:hypothetical protein